MLTVRLAASAEVAEADDGTLDTSMMAFVKPTATVGVTEDDESAKEEDGATSPSDESEEDSRDDAAPADADAETGERTEPRTPVQRSGAGSTTTSTPVSVKPAASVASSPPSTALTPANPAPPASPSLPPPAPHHESEMIKHLVLAKLSNLESHQKRRDEASAPPLPLVERERSRSLKKDRGERRRRRPHNTAAKQLRSKLLRAPDASQHAANALTPSYSLLELTKPYPQADLLQTLAEQMADDPALPHHARLDCRFSSSNSASSEADPSEWSPHQRDDSAESDSAGALGQHRLTREKSDPLISPPPAPTLGHRASLLSQGSGGEAPVLDATAHADQSGLALLRKGSGASSRTLHTHSPHVQVTASSTEAEGETAANGASAAMPQPSPPSGSSEHSLHTPTFGSSPAGSPLTPPARPSSTTLPAGPRPPSPQVTGAKGASPVQKPGGSPSAGSTGRSVVRSTSRGAQPRQTIPAIADEYPLSLLVAEDNPINTKMIGGFLQRLGYKVEFAANGEEVLACWKRRVDKGEQPHDVVLMDVNMDEMDGYECTRRLRRLPAGGRVYIIAQTANASMESKSKCLESGMNAFLPKPIIVEELARQLKMAYRALDEADRDKRTA